MKILEVLKKVLKKVLSGCYSHLGKVETDFHHEILFPGFLQPVLPVVVEGKSKAHLAEIVC